MRIPFDEVGGECVHSCEIDPYARKTYRANFGRYPDRDITHIDATEIPAHDLLIAGFPCQPFSRAGKKKGFSDTRGTLFFHIEQIIRLKQPRVALLENVANLSEHDEGRTLQTITRCLAEAGYKVSHSVLDSAHFGLPQRRKRIYIVCVREDIKCDFTFPRVHTRRTNINVVLEPHVGKKYTLSDTSVEWHEEHARKQEAKGNGFKFRVYPPHSEATCTITARYSSDGSRALIAQPGQNPRRLTPREVARLQGFPDSFKIVGSDNQAYRQFGNAVSVPVVRAICRELVSAKAFRQGTRSRAKRPSKFQQ